MAEIFPLVSAAIVAGAVTGMLFVVLTLFYGGGR